MRRTILLGVLLTCGAAQVILSYPCLAGQNEPTQPPSGSAKNAGISKAKVDQTVTTETDIRGTKTQPAVVELASSPMLRVEAIDRTIRARDYSSSEWFLTYGTALLALITAGLAIATYRLFRATVQLGRDAKISASAQSERMERSVTEANRAAIAMESVAAATTNNASLVQSMMQKQMRAYVAVELGTAIYQDEKNRFEAMPMLLNTGYTPARDICFTISAAIIDSGSSADVSFPAGMAIIVNDVSLAPRQPLTFRGIAKNRIPDGDVAAVMAGSEERLHAWGKVTYKDVFGGSWETNFCVNYTFRKVGSEMRVFGSYFHAHNNAT
jgi:hypothetical protein